MLKLIGNTGITTERQPHRRNKKETRESSTMHRTTSNLIKLGEKLQRFGESFQILRLPDGVLELQNNLQNESRQKPDNLQESATIEDTREVSGVLSSELNELRDGLLKSKASELDKTRSTDVSYVTNSGAKGTTLNFLQMMELIGQQCNKNGRATYEIKDRQHLANRNKTLERERGEH